MASAISRIFEKTMQPEPMSRQKKFLVLYYSKTGNSRFLAGRIAENLGADLRSLKPPVSGTFLLFLLSRMRVPLGAGIAVKDLEKYDEVVLLGPVWGGIAIAPLRTAIRICIKAGKPLHFAVSCDIGDEEKDSKYGYGPVLKEARRLAGQYLLSEAAFPNTLLEVAEPPKSLKTSEKVRIEEANYKGAMEGRVAIFIREIQNALPKKAPQNETTFQRH